MASKNTKILFIKSSNWRQMSSGTKYYMVGYSSYFILAHGKKECTCSTVAEGLTPRAQKLKNRLDQFYV